MVGEFAQIVGLLAAFASNRQGRSTNDHLEFLNWLTEHGHEDIRKAIELNHSTTISVQALIHHGFEQVNAKLDYLSGQAAILSSGLDGIGTLGSHYSQYEISESCLTLLTVMEDNDTEFFLISQALGTDVNLVLSPGPNFNYPEPRFFKDDMELVVRIELLRLDYNSRGDEMYYFTRKASGLVKEMRN